VRPGHIVIGVMAYYGKADDPVRGAGVRRQYVERMARFAAREIEEGRTITMVIGDLADQDVALEIETLVRRERPDLRLDQLRVSNAVTFEDIMREMAEAELVVASRFHNIIGALKLAKPTVSLGYAQKNASLLEQFGYGEYVQAMDELDPDLLVDQVAHAEESRAAQGRQITSVLARFESDLDEQFRTLSTGTFVPGQRRQDVLR
jgi:polysaccharide pyruvyl transferase WcaK-like protein